MHYHYIYVDINVYLFNLAVASDLISLSRPYRPPMTLELGPAVISLDIALYEHTFSSLYLILLAL